MRRFTAIPVVLRKDIEEVSNEFINNHNNEPFWFLELLKQDGQDHILREIHSLTEGVTKNDTGDEDENVSFEHVNARGFIRGLAFGYLLLRSAQERK
jgi:hypothetical protein